MKKRWLIITALLLIGLLPVGLLTLLNNQTSSRWLIQHALPLLPAKVSVADVQGKLFGGLHLAGFSYQTNDLSVTFKQLDLDWTPSQLTSRKLWISGLAIDGLSIELKSSNTNAQPVDLNFNLALPVDVQLDNLLLTNLEFKTDQQAPQKIQKLQVSLHSERDQLTITQLAVIAEPLQATLHGQVKLGNNFPLKLSANWQTNITDYGLWIGTTNVSGDLKQLNIDSQLTSPFKLAIKGLVTDPLQQAKLALHGDWQAMQWPVIGTPQIKSEQGVFDIMGTLDDYQLKIDAQLSQPYIPKASLQFAGQGSLQDLLINKLDLNSSTGLLSVTGKLAWQNAFSFDLTASGKNFNPGLLVPEIPGNLTFVSHTQGQLGEPITLTAEIKQLSGKLRGYPVSADGKFALNGQLLQIDALNLNSGNNRIAINGKLSQAQSALDVTINAPTLATIWPTLTGNLQATANIQGTLEKPVLSLKAKGKQLGFAGNTLSQLAIDVALDANKMSTVSVQAENLRSGAVQMQKLFVTGLGTPAQHSFKMGLRSNQGNLNTALTGNYQAGVWTGNVSQLDVSRQDLGLWQLQKPIKVAVNKDFKSVVEQVCLHQQTASVCAEGQYTNSQDYQLKAQIVNLSSLSLKAFLPKDVTVTSTIDADLQLQQKLGQRTGHYQLHTTPINLTLPSAQQTLALALGNAKAFGAIKDNNVSADVDLALTGSDYARAQVQYNLVNQSISGQLNGSVNQFAILQAFLPQLSSLTGQATANLAIKGQLPMPKLTGQLAFTNGQITLQTMGLSLSDINLQAQAIDDHIQLQASAAPSLLKGSDYYQQLQLQGLLKLNANFTQKNSRYTGEYRLDMPAGTVRLLQPIAKPLGAVYLAGHIDDKKHVADFNAMLVDNDFIRAGLEIGSGKEKSLSGHVIASLNQFSLLNPFVPQLSNLKGSLNANMALSGTLEKPLATGSVNLTNTSFNINELGTQLSEVKLQAQVAGVEKPHVLVNGFAKSGNGNLVLNGLIDLDKQADQNVNLHLTGSNFEAAKLPEAQIEITPDLTLLVAAGKAKVNGTIKVPKATIVMQELPENAVAVSKDEIIIGKENIEITNTYANAIAANVLIELGKQVSFSGQGLKSNLTGKLTVIKDGQNTSMRGEINMEKARYKSYGQDLTVRKGRFVFNGAIDNPYLDVEAIRVSNDKKVTAILSVTGQLNTPKTQVSTQPAMPESDAMAYLVTGKSLSQVSKSENNMLAGAALSYGAGKASWLTSKLGIDEFDIEQGKTLQDSLVTVGQYLSPDFYVGTKVGLFNKQASVILKYVIMPGLNVETQTGSSKRVKLNYEIDRD